MFRKWSGGFIALIIVCYLLFMCLFAKKLVDPGRVLVGEGVLNKQCRKKLKPRQV